jgi:hypothetical protein
MRNLTMTDLRLGLADLFDKRGDTLKATQTGKLYGPILAAKRKAIDGVLAASAASARSSTTGDIGEIDELHDGLGAAVWHYTEAAIRHPFLDAETRAAARRVREAFIPDLGLLRDSYAHEAAAAQQNRPKLAELEADLRRLSTPDGKTLYDWVSAFLDQADRLSRQLSARSQATGYEAFRQHTALRVTTIGLLGRFRAALRDELAEHPALPRDLDARTFSYFDDLVRHRDAATQATPPAGTDG